MKVVAYLAFVMALSLSLYLFQSIESIIFAQESEGSRLVHELSWLCGARRRIALGYRETGSVGGGWSTSGVMGIRRRCKATERID